ncbi:ABC transporter substrate-binding protein [Nonomuraea sp. CA-141351]|uniref:ABC transporter substrate-binding protein n=1 Tax=Nonomuraea sp. CA-141351 TaxID=3239996 RepID=UPI003D939438
MTLSRREFTIAAAVLVLGAGCGTASRSSGPKSTARTLQVGQSLPPVSLDPARSGGESALYVGAAYDPLIYRAPDGTYQPRLATSWRYTDKGNTAFELTLRQGVTFSDGTPLTAAAVKANIDYFRQAAGQAAAFLAPITQVEVAGDRTVRLGLSAPHPQLPALFSQDFFAGNLISPAAIAQPAKLAAQTFGAGPYTLASEETVANDHYTYVRNPAYWNAGDQHYDKIVIRVLPNENTALAALKTGQADVIAGSYAIVGGAKSAGLQVASTPNVVFGLQLNDRTGKLSQPLGKQQVRQALNFSVDRQKITTALLGEYGVPTEQLAASGQDGYNDTAFYTYDKARARRLLAEAGYPDGFRLPVLIPSTPAFFKDIVQAVAADLREVGVTLEITAKEPAAAVMELSKYPASSLGWGVLPPYFMGRGLWLRDAIGMNPFHSADDVLQDLDAKAAAADESSRAELDRRIVRRVTELGWFLPVCLSPVFFLHRDTVNLGAVPGKPLPSLSSWRPGS